MRQSHFHHEFSGGFRTCLQGSEQPSYLVAYLVGYLIALYFFGGQTHRIWAYIPSSRLSALPLQTSYFTLLPQVLNFNIPPVFS